MTRKFSFAAYISADYFHGGALVFLTLKVCQHERPPLCTCDGRRRWIFSFGCPGIIPCRGVPGRRFSERNVCPGLLTASSDQFQSR